MYRTGDPRFRRRLNEIGQSLETANEAAQSELYVFSQNYIKPCFESFTSCIRTCVDASCPTLNLNATQRDRLRRQRGRSRGRAELNFDFYDDWDEDLENDALMGWGGGEEFDRLLASSGGYGTLSSTTTTQQPGRQRGMSYPKGRRKSAVQLHDGEDPTVIPAGTSFFGKLFGGKAKGLKYKPSAAGLQEHPGTRRGKDGMTEGEALLEEDAGTGRRKRHGRNRSGTATSGHTTDSLSSRGDIFPSDEELDDAIPLDDEFAMVLERRTTQSIGPSGQETESSSARTRPSSDRRTGKRPSTGSRTSTRSSRSRGGRQSRSRTNSSAAESTIEEALPEMEVGTSLSELKQEERRLEQEEETEVERKREEAQRLAEDRGLASSQVEELSSKAATPAPPSPITRPSQEAEEPSQLPTPSETEDEEEDVLSVNQTRDDSHQPPAS